MIQFAAKFTWDDKAFRKELPQLSGKLDYIENNEVFLGENNLSCNFEKNIRLVGTDKDCVHITFEKDPSADTNDGKLLPVFLQATFKPENGQEQVRRYQVVNPPGVYAIRDCLVGPSHGEVAIFDSVLKTAKDVFNKN